MNELERCQLRERDFEGVEVDRRYDVGHGVGDAEDVVEKTFLLVDVDHDAAVVGREHA